MLKSAPVAFDNLMLTHNKINLIPPADTAAMQNTTVRGNCSSDGVLILKKLKMRMIALNGDTPTVRLESQHHGVVFPKG